MQKHDGLDHVCVDCRFKTHAQRVLVAQRSLHHHDSSEVLACDICTATLQTRRSLAKYMWRHKESSRAKLKCSMCDLEAKTAQQLHIHVRSVHEKARDFACAQCEYATTQGGQFN